MTPVTPAARGARPEATGLSDLYPFDDIASKVKGACKVAYSAKEKAFTTKAKEKLCQE